MFLMTPEDLGPRIRGERMTLNNFTSNMFQPTKFNATWQKEKSLTFVNYNGDLELLDVNNFSRKVLISRNVFVRLFLNSVKYSNIFYGRGLLEVNTIHFPLNFHGFY